jgi:esterase/lipase superfamily enzyme
MHVQVPTNDIRTAHSVSHSSQFRGNLERQANVSRLNHSSQKVVIFSRKLD